MIVTALKNRGRLLYFGAGTSGRIGVVDAAECPPTFGTSPELIQGFIAGGREAMFRAQEGAEDLEENGAKDVIKAKVNSERCCLRNCSQQKNSLCNWRCKKSKRTRRKTIYVTCNPREEFDIKEVDVAICPYVGPEVIMGSTRMKSGTAQKLVLNMLTTASMIRLGKVYENMMIDLQMNNKKLVERSKRIVMTITGASYEKAADILEKADGHVKTALVMIKGNVSATEARKRLKKADGFVRKAIELSK